jgi:hypothetical protein
MKLILAYIVIVLAVLGIGYWLFTSSQKAQDPANQPGQAFDIVGQTHIAEGANSSMAYNSNPPTSGDHWPQPAACGSYDSTQPDEKLIHNLEHGGIWISYKPSIDDQSKTRLKDYASRFQNVIIEPREANDSNIALAAWGRLLKLESYDEGKILEFIDAYIDRGPELVPCAPM